MLLRLALPPFLFLGLIAAHPLAAQAVFQPADKPLFVPSLIQTADAALAGITVASLPGIPFTATVDVENRTLSPKGAVIIHRLTGKLARDSRGSLRTVVDLNTIGRPYDQTQVTIQIYDAQRKTVLTLFPAARFAYHWSEEAEPQLARHPSRVDAKRGDHFLKSYYLRAAAGDRLRNSSKNFCSSMTRSRARFCKS